MSFRPGFSTQGQFEIPLQDTVYAVSMTKNKSLNTPDLSAPLADSWYLYHPIGRNIQNLAIKNIGTNNNDVLYFSYTNGIRWTQLDKGESWSGEVSGVSFIKVKSNNDTVLFQLTVSGD